MTILCLEQASRYCHKGLLIYPSESVAFQHLRLSSLHFASPSKIKRTTSSSSSATIYPPSTQSKHEKRAAKGKDKGTLNAKMQVWFRRLQLQRALTLSFGDDDDTNKGYNVGFVRSVRSNMYCSAMREKKTRSDRVKKIEDVVECWSANRFLPIDP